MDYSFECNSSFSYISLLFDHIYIQSFLSSESSDSLIFLVSNCTFKQWLLHQIVIQIEVIQEQIMQWCSFSSNLRFYKIILVYLTNR